MSRIRRPGSESILRSILPGLPFGCLPPRRKGLGAKPRRCGPQISSAAGHEAVLFSSMPTGPNLPTANVGRGLVAAVGAHPAIASRSDQPRDGGYYSHRPGKSGLHVGLFRRHRLGSTSAVA